MGLRQAAKGKPYRKTSRHSEDIGWLFGFISGYNEFDNIPKRPFLSQDEANLQKAIDQRCAASPDKLVKETVLAFVNGLNKSEKAAFLLAARPIDQPGKKN
jgi:hypothetical protein